MACTMEYTNYLKEQIKRLRKIAKFDEKMKLARKQSEIDYYKDYMNILFEKNENPENYKQVIAEYEYALQLKEELIEKLKHEIEIIKNLKT